MRVNEWLMGSTDDKINMSAKPGNKNKFESAIFIFTEVDAPYSSCFYFNM